MKRKAIQLANKTLVVSLPAKWVKKYAVQKGDEVEVEQNGNQLILSTQQHRVWKVATVDISGKKYIARRLITAYYKAGYDEIHIQFRTPEEFEWIQYIMLRLVPGFEITHQTKNIVDVKNISQNDFSQFEVVLRRLFLIINQIAEEGAHAIEQHDFSWMHTLILLKSEVGKFSDYCRRALNMNYPLPFKYPAPLYAILEQLERISRVYRGILEYISSQKLVVSKDTMNLLKDVAQYIHSFYDLFYNFSLEKNEQMGVERELLLKKLVKLEFKVSRNEIRILSFLDRVINQTFDLTGILITLYAE